MDRQRIQSLSGLPAGRWCGRRIQRKVHDQSDGAARGVAGHAGQPCATQLPELLPSGQALAVQWRAPGTRPLTGTATDARLHRPDAGGAGSVADAAVAGLLQPQKTLPAKLFYDEEGCRLFGRITELPEYYLTRTERALLAIVAPRVTAALSVPACWWSTAPVTRSKAGVSCCANAIAALPCSGPMCRSTWRSPQLEQMRARLRQRRPDLSVFVVPADFMDVVALPDAHSLAAAPWLLPGSTIGNLDPPEARRFLRQARADARHGRRCFWWVSICARIPPCCCPPTTTRRASRRRSTATCWSGSIARPAPTSISDAFAHRAVWNDAESRIEMHLVSRREQQVRVAGQTIRFAHGETIHTENSYKYAPEHFAELAEAAGLALRGAVDRSGAACFRCICWNRGAAPETRSGWR